MRSSAAERAAAFALALSCAACGPPEPTDVTTGTADGSFDCEIFLPGSNPSNTGDGAITVTLDGHERVLAQGAAGYAVDASGNQTLDPSAASYFAVQVVQYIAEDELEIFELRVLPDDWLPDVEIPFDGDRGIAFFGTIRFDGNGNPLPDGARIEASATHGTLTLSAAGRNPRDPVIGTLSGVRLAGE